MRRLATLLFILIAVCALAQTHKPAARENSAPTVPQEPDHFNLVAITVRGTQRYSDSEVLAASKLAPGMSVTQAELQQASNRLGDTGVFSTVAYHFASAPGGMRMTLELTDNPVLVPVMFQNLVWVPDDALLAALRQRVPLFQERIPLAGQMSQQVRDTLQAILAEKGVKVSVSQMLSTASGDGSTSLAYRTDDAQVRIVGVDFAGRKALDPGLLGGVVDSLERDHFFMPVTGQAGKQGIEDVYLAQGYLAITVADPRVALVDPSPTAPAVKLTFPVEEGKQYNLAGVEWSGNTAVPAAELSAKLSLPLGQPVNLPRLQRELGSARALYLKKGYMNAGFEPVPQLRDDATALINIKVHEGAQYKMGTLTLTGLDPATEQKIRSQWGIPAGGVYDDSYPARFVNEAIGSLPPGIHFQFMQTTKIDDQTGTVDVTIEYKHR